MTDNFNRLSEEQLKKEISKAESEVAKGLKQLSQAIDGNFINEVAAASPDSLAESVKSTDQLVVIDGVEILPPNNKADVKAEIQAAEEKDRARRVAYEKDRTFFEENVLSKSRSLCEIQDDYVKILHPYYREKFIAGIEKYGTIYAAMKYMKDNHGLKLRGDVLGRIAQMIPSFKQEIEDAQEEYKAMLHMEMQRRAVDGIDKGIYHNGELVATEKVYSDSLLVKMVDTHNPDYKEAKQKDSKWGNQINVQIIKDFHNYKEK